MFARPCDVHHAQPKDAGTKCACHRSAICIFSLSHPRVREACEPYVEASRVGCSQASQELSVILDLTTLWTKAEARNDRKRQLGTSRNRCPQMVDVANTFGRRNLARRVARGRQQKRRYWLALACRQNHAVGAKDDSRRKITWYKNLVHLEHEQ